MVEHVVNDPHVSEKMLEINTLVPDIGSDPFLLSLSSS